ncbi:MAG: GNAT family N-acetyltransferase [Deltaproteobacteria bacterium]|nr:GNAT family N-acetyltransferase [Deltaproteobacteria bacterium]
MHSLVPTTAAHRDAVWRVHRAAFSDIAEASLGAGFEERMQREFDEAFEPMQIRLVVEDEQVLGFVHLQREEGDRFLKTMAVVPAHQGRGLGAEVLRGLQAEAEAAGDSLTLSVYETNPALRLYARQGFARLGQDGIRIRMRWVPDAYSPPFEPGRWGWTHARVTPVLEGENELFRVDAEQGSFAVRLYRAGRRTPAQVVAEWSWAEALAERLPVVPAVPTPAGDLIVTVPDGRLAVAMPWVEGRTVRIDTPEQAERLGRLLGQLRGEADRVQAENWAPAFGHRPVYDPASDVQVTLSAFEGETFARPEQVTALRALASRLLAALARLPLMANAFVHADAHRWNLLDDGEDWWLIDFDDCGFGPPESELATIRTHLRAAGTFDQLRAGLMAGWGPHDPSRVALAAACHVFATIGEFPSHLDMGPLASDAQGTLDRYLSYCEAELAEGGIDGGV